MKIAGIAMVWFGVVALLKNIGVIQIVDWSIIWPVILIVLGLSMKYCKHSMMYSMSGMCRNCGKGASACTAKDGMKCEGPDCEKCNK